MSSRTHATSSSSGSGSTVTGACYSKSRARYSTRHPVTPSAKSRTESIHLDHLTSRKGVPDVSEESFDVFDYQEPDEQHEHSLWNSGPSSHSSSSSDDDDSAVENVKAGTKRQVSFARPSPRKDHGQDIHSDSGISVRGGTPDSVSVTGSVYEPPLPVSMQHDDKTHIVQGGGNPNDRVEAPEAFPNSKFHYLVPFSYSPSSPSANSPFRRASSPYAATPPPAVPSPPPQPSYPHVEKLQRTGYDLLASRLSADGSRMTPIYRRFEGLHHRVLLHLQDELAEMEEALQRIDRSIEEQHRLHPGPRIPGMASRRDDRDFGNAMEAHRNDIMARIYAKTQHYREALVAYRATVLGDPRARKEDIVAYRKFLKGDGHPIITDRELRFLDHEADLITPAADQAKRLIRKTHELGDSTFDEKRGLVCGAILLVFLASDSIQTLLWRGVLLLAAIGAWSQRHRITSRGVNN